jgi:hypothetical protein
VEELLVNAPETVKAKAREALRKGQAAAAQGNRAAASQEINSLATQIEYRAAGFPLDKVRADVHSAWEAARGAEPNWMAIAGSLKSALAEMHWVTRIEAYGLLRAYYETRDAAAILPDSPPQGKAYLRQAAKDLSETPGMAELAGKVLALAHKQGISVSDVREMVSKLGERLRLAQQQAAARYLKSNGSAQP